MPPFLGGGDMIKRVELRSFSVNELPYKFEAGTPAIAEAIGLGVAVDYLTAIGMENIEQHEQVIAAYLLERLEEIPGVKVFGPAAEHKGAVASFTLSEAHAHDISQIPNIIFLPRHELAFICITPLKKLTDWLRGFIKSRKFLRNG
jgi:cysteine desulfurase/selenocysteine lyase